MCFNGENFPYIFEKLFIFMGINLFDNVSIKNRMKTKIRNIVYMYIMKIYFKKKFVTGCMILFMDDEKVKQFSELLNTNYTIIELRILFNHNFFWI